MEVRDNPISKSGVYPYLGSEIPGAANPDQIYYVYRPAEELARQETIDSFKLMPFIDEHEVLGTSGMAAERKGIQGTIGEQVYFDPPYLRGNIKIHSSAAQSLIKAGKVELSPCYGCDWEEESGTFEGKPYQYVQRNIMGNHLALVEEGRTGPDVAVQDHRKFTLDSKELLPMALAPEDMEAIKTMVLELLAANKAGDETPEEKAAKEQAAADEEAAKAAADAEEPAVKAEGDYAEGDETRAAERIEEIVEQVEEAIEEVKEAAEDLTKASDAKSRRAAQDRMTVAKSKLDKAKSAHANFSKDSASRKLQAQVEALTKQVASLAKAPAKDSGNGLLGLIADRDAIYTSVKPFTGVFDHARMDAAGVARYACDKLSIKCAAGTESIALDAWLQGRKPDQPSAHAADSKVAGGLLKDWSKK